MTFRMSIDGIWREFSDVREAVYFIDSMKRCLNCGGPKSTGSGRLCRICYRSMTAEEKRCLTVPGKMIGYIKSDL